MLLILINGMGYWFVCFKWDLILYLKTFQWHFRIVKMPVTSRQHGKRLMLSLSTKKETNKFWVIIDQFPSCVFVANLLKKSFLIQYFNTWRKTMCLIQISLNFSWQFLHTSVYFNYPWNICVSWCQFLIIC